MFQEALQVYDNAMRKDPKNAHLYHYFNGEIFEKLGKYEEALKEYDSAIKRSPTNSWYRQAKIYLLERMNRLEDALKEAEVLVKMDPSAANQELKNEIPAKLKNKNDIKV
jgi:tetratricopeptide (TPR) repeat protein